VSLTALVMVFTISIPVMGGTYDVASTEPDETTWSVFRLYHWVVRGDTLFSIANIWGTTEENIRLNPKNRAYFEDLALRNVTYGTNIQLEPGVKLHIFDTLRARATTPA